MEIMTFLVLEDDLKFSSKVSKLIERKLTEVANIECKIVTASTCQQALQFKNELEIDIHVVDLDLPGKGNGFDYLEEVAKDYDQDEPILPVIIMSSHEEDFYQLRAFRHFKAIGFMEKSKFDDKCLLSDFIRAVKMMRRMDDKLVTFTRPGEVLTYKEKNVLSITRGPNRSKKMLVTIYNEKFDEAVKEEFSLKRSLLEVPDMFSSSKCMVRCHKQYLVNPRAIIGRRGDKLVLLCGETVPLGGEFADKFSY